MGLSISLDYETTKKALNEAWKLKTISVRYSTRKRRESASGLVNGPFDEDFPALKPLYMLYLFRFHSSGAVLKFSISIHSWIMNTLLVMLMWLHLTWLAKEFCDSVRHLAWNGNMWKRPQKYNKPAYLCLAYFTNFPLCSFTNWKETNMPVFFDMHSLH